MDNYYYGYSNKQQTIKVGKDTVFGIGSITKTFASMIILKLESNKDC
ncbi:serine hydrolase [Francisella sp. 19S2-10]